MIQLFSKGSLTILESLSFTKTLYAFDFDGTLAKIVSAPTDAYMTETTESLLKQLSELVPVAIVSGRSLQDLKDRVGFHPQFLIGNHGLEALGKNKNSLLEAEKVCKKWGRVLGNKIFESGVEIEDKTYSLALHYRRSRHKKLARNQLRSAIEDLTPYPRVIEGKSVYNLLPPGSQHKGAAMLDLIKKSNIKHAFYIGDDDTDEDVFSVPYEDGQLMTVRVGSNQSSYAKYFIHRQSEINRLLRILIGFHKPLHKKEKKG